MFGCILSACSPNQGMQGPEQKAQSKQGVEKQSEEPRNSNEEKADKSQGPNHNRNKTEIEKQKEKSIEAFIPENVNDIPNTEKEILSFPVGKFGSVKFFGDKEKKIKETLSGFPQLKQGNDPEKIKKYFLALLGLFAKDYPDPKDLLNEFKQMNFGNPNIKDPRFQFKENFNVEIILDSSGSMAAYVGGQTKMELAKKAILDFAKSLPKKANVGLRVYGQKGSSSDADKKISCNSSKLVYNIQPYNKAKLEEALKQFEPSGWTPLAKSLKLAMKDLQDLKAKHNTNVIYVVSDGIETCEGNPVKVANQLAESDINPIVNVIGFNVSSKGQKQLKAVAKAAKGNFVYIQNQEGLQQAFNKTKEMVLKWRQWRKDATLKSRAEHKERTLAIRRLSKEWTLTSRAERKNLFYAVRMLKKYDLISDKASENLNQLVDKRFKRIKRIGDKRAEFLQSLNNKTYQEARKAIKEKFNTHKK